MAFGILGLVLVLLILGAYRMKVVATRAVEFTPDVAALLGETAVEILNRADRAEVFRVDPLDYQNPRKILAAPADRLGGYRVTGPGAEQSRRYIGELRSLLFDRGTYQMDAAKGCKFRPVVGIRLPDPESGRRAEVLLCFGCDELRVVTFDADGSVLHSHTADFDPRRPQFVFLARMGLLRDKEIQELPDVRPGS